MSECVLNATPYHLSTKSLDFHAITTTIAASRFCDPKNQSLGHSSFSIILLPMPHKFLKHVRLSPRKSIDLARIILKDWIVPIIFTSGLVHPYCLPISLIMDSSSSKEPQPWMRTSSLWIMVVSGVDIVWEVSFRSIYEEKLSLTKSLEPKWSVHDFPRWSYFTTAKRGSTTGDPG